MNAEKASENVRRIWFAAVWFALTCLMLWLAHLEAERQTQVRVWAFQTELSDLAEISKVVMAGRLRRYDDTLLILREAYVKDRAHFAERVQWMRSGPLRDPELLVVVVDREGFLAFTDYPGGRPRLDLRDRPYFRFFADGGQDRFFVDEPIFGRTTQRYSVPLVRPMYDAQGQFQGVIAISVRQDSLANFGDSLTLRRDATVTAVTHKGAIVTRSHDLDQVQGTSIAPSLLASLLKGTEGVFASEQSSDGTTRTYAYRHLPDTPLIVYVASSDQAVRAVSAQARTTLMGSAGFAAFLGLLLTLAYLQRRKAVDRYIETQRAYLKDAQRIAGMGSWELDIGSQRFRWSDEVYRLYAVDREQFSPDMDTFLSLVLASDRDAVRAEIEKAIVQGHGEIEFTLCRGDGQVREMLGRGEALRDRNGRTTALIGTVRDITEQRTAERELIEGELRYRTLTRVVPVGIFRADARGDFTYVNDRFCEFAGMSHNSVLGHGWAAAIHPEDRARVVGAWFASVHARNHFVEEMRLVRADASQRWVMAEAQEELSLEGEVIGYVGSVTDITETKNAEELLRYFYDLSFVGMAITSAATQAWVKFNDKLCAIFGYTRAELHGLGWSDLVHPEDRDMDREAIDGLRAGLRDGYTLERRFVRKDGQVIYAAVEVRCARNAAGAVELLVAMVQDVTERRLNEEQLRIAATTFESQEGMLITDAHNVILKVNSAFTEVTGYSPDEVIGRSPRMLQSGRHDEAFYEAMWACIRRTGKWQGEIWDRHKSGRIFPKWLSISAVRNAQGVVTHYVGTQTDITERKQAEEKINQLAFYDALTGLPNRTLLMDRLKQLMNASVRSGSHNALLFIDLDNFKTLNDTQGHDKGDLLLQQIAQRLSATVRDGDTVTRLGGDEFVVMLAGLGHELADAAARTEAIGDKILGALNQAYRLGNSDYHGTASVGATLFCGQQVSIDDLLKQADMAMYKAKESGRNTLRFFDPTMEAAVMERSALEEDLRTALAQAQFLLHYQAQIADGGRVVGVEVLLRWQHPRRRLVSPAQFIPLAEDTGLIKPLGLWVLETACRHLARWAGRPELAHLTIAVNVSAKQFRDAAFVEQVKDILARTQADPGRLKLELTESLLVDNVQDTIEKMHALKARGIGFSLDDFGTGYSSLSYLKRLPLDQLKIDQSFVRDVLVDPNDAAIARTIIALSASLGLHVIAEGVETAAQRDFLAASGCHAYQGYFFSRPLPLEEFEAFACSGPVARAAVQT